MNKFVIIADIDCGVDVLVVMGEAKPKETGMACSSQDAMMVIRDKNRNKRDFPLPTHFPFRPGERDKIVKHRGCNEIPPDPPWPTDYIPGTPEKLEVMAWRFRMGYALHHPLDVRLNTSRKFVEHQLSDVG